MRSRFLYKKGKCVVSLWLAVAVFLNGWCNGGICVYAEEEQREEYKKEDEQEDQVEFTDENDIDLSVPAIEGLETFYYKTAADKEVTFQVIEGTYDIAEVMSNDEENAVISILEDGSYTVTFRAAGSYMIIVTDTQDNQVLSEEITVVEDRQTPNIAVTLVENDGGYRAQDSNKLYYFKDYLSVNLTLTEEETPEDEVHSPILLKRNKIVLLETSEDECFDSFTDMIEESGVYVYTVEDIAGNKNAVEITISAQKSSQEPKIDVQYLESPIFIDETAFFKNDPNIILNATDNLGIAKVEYQLEGEEFFLLKDYAPDDVCMVGANVDYERTLEDILLGLEDGSYHYNFRVTNMIGAVAEQELEFCVDKTSPDSRIFVAYETDGTNEETTPEQNTGIIDFLGNAIDKLFGKEKVWFHLYVKDGMTSDEDNHTVSGIDTQDLVKQIKSAYGNAVLREVQVMDDKTAEFVYEGNTYKGYSHIMGCMVLPSDELGYAQDQIQIPHLRDRVGNMTKVMGAENITGTTIVYLDCKAPILLAKYPDGVIEENDENSRIFYTHDTSIELMLKESCYGLQTDIEGKPVSPEVTMKENGTDNFHVSDTKWTVVSKEEALDYDAFTTLNFPLSENPCEIEYDFQIKYQDASGNLLEAGEGCKGNIVNGSFLSYTLILDNKAPELTAFSIEGNTDRQVNGVNIYQNVEGSDVTLSFAIDDHASYWNPAALKLKLYNRTTGKLVAEVNGKELKWNSNERSHASSYAFDGDGTVEPSNYYAVISYADRAGNPLKNGGVSYGNLNEHTGTYTSPDFLLDHQAPVFHISYQEATRLVKNSDTNPENDKIKQMPLTGYTAYYNQDIQVKFSIEEACALPILEENKILGLMDFYLTIQGKSGKIYQPKIYWMVKEGTFEGEFTLTEEDTYQIIIEYQDPAANNMIAGNVAGSSTNMEVSEDGIYESTILALDKTAPMIQTAYIDTAQNTLIEGISKGQKRIYFAQPVYLQIEVEDQNVRFHEVKEMLKEMKIFDSKLQPIQGSDAENFMNHIDETKIEQNKFYWYIPLTTEANYDILPSCEDLAGNKAVFTIEKVSVDVKEPELELYYEVSPTGFMDVLHYGDLRYLFADNRLTITASAKDATAGIHRMKYTIIDENGKKTEDEKIFDPIDEANHSVTIPIKSADFKGTILTEAFDWSGNRIEKTEGYIVESADRHNHTESAVITTYTAPKRTVNGEDFYNTDIHFNLRFKDDYSGLKKLSYSGGSTLSKTIDYTKEPNSENIIYEYSEDMTLSAAANNENDVLVQAEFTDHAGHTSSVEQIYHIDITVPVITVEYDLNDPFNERFYNQPRTATVTIQERNFDENDVNFIITSSEAKMPAIGGWTSSGVGDEMLHTCQVVFQEDGDYTFSVSFEDKAGNKADYNQIDEFTIDQTDPILTISYDNNQSTQESYYARSRKAVIDILEHNFDPEQIAVIITADGADVPMISGWSQDKDHNTATILFEEDAEYTLDISGIDRAGNSLGDFEPEHFTIDKTAPELEILGIEDRSANNGMVMPKIRCFDKHYDPNSIKLQLRGAHTGEKKINGTIDETTEGIKIYMEDFPYLPKMDDLYTLEASACDLAGNKSEAHITFSVNRFGSVYTFDEQTSRLVGEDGTYYTKKEQDIVVTETNVDSLEFKEITCSLNGELRTMKEGADYTILNGGTEESWKQYTYIIDKDNFTEEGVYVLTIYSEDRALNASDNHTKGKGIAFAVDRTAPSILFSGVEDGKQYRENSREVILDIQDNVCMGEVKIAVNGKEQNYSAKEIEKLGGKIVLRLESANHWQTLCIKASDAAGNEQELEEIRFLITSNVIVQFLMNRLLLGSTFGVLAILSVGCFRISYKRKRKGKMPCEG